VIEHLRSGFFRCELPLIARTSAMMLRRNIKVTSGDIVRVVLDGHGLSHGRITYHYSEAS
jgi:translation initiation factor IF-1